MTEEEIEKRIEHCELMEQAHREVGNTKSANRFNNEKYKWEKLLQKLDPKKDEELRIYKTGYYNLKQVLNEVKEYIHSEEFFMLMNSGSIIDCPSNKPVGEDYFKSQNKLDKIIDKFLGDEK